MTDDAGELRARLEAVTGERIAALEGIGGTPREAPGKDGEAALRKGRTPEADAATEGAKQRDSVGAPSRDREIPPPERGRTREMDLEL